MDVATAVEPQAERRAQPILSLSGIEKSYPGAHALRGIDLEIAAGTVRALVGENGAGKSTLLKIIYGAETADRGTIAIDGKKIGHLTPRVAQEHGIRLVSQERQIALDLSVAENVLLGRMPRFRTGVINWRAARREAAATLERLELDIDPGLPAHELPVGSLQAIEIARALSANARLIVMDEPTAALGAAEIQALFRIIRGLRTRGVAILYVSHHLEEIFEIAESVTVLRDGTHVATRPAEGLDADQVISMMLGRALRTVEEPRRPQSEHEVLLRLAGVAKRPGLNDVSLIVRRGEIIGVAGAIGSGRAELAQCAAGVVRPDAGRVEVGTNGAIPHSSRDAVRHGAVFVPQDRKRHGLFLDLNLVDNIGIGRFVFQRHPFAWPGPRRRAAQALCRQLGVRSSGIHAQARQLSGGNQQKAMLARWLNVDAQIFIFDEPTAGIDVGAKLEIYSLLRRLADQGAAVLILSSDLQEIKLLAHRAIVLRKGVIAGELHGDEITDAHMLRLLMGAQ